MGDASRERIFVATLILVSLLAAAPLWGPGMVNTRGGGDSPFLLQRTHQLLANLRAGVFPVRWMPDAAYGLGYPFFSYYAALPYYLAGFLALIGIDILTALKLVQTMGFVAAALATYGWMRRATGNRWAAWLAATAYTVAPFHLINVYVRGDSLSEFYAFVFYPLILWSLDALSKPASLQSGIRDPRSAICNLQFAVAALAFAGLILTHNISAFIFSPFALLYLVMLSWQRRAAHWRVLGIGLLALGFGFLLSAWFWLPALAELGHVQLGPSTQDFFHYSRHFRTLNMVQPGLLFDFSTTTNHRLRSPFAMGLVQAAFATLGGLVLIVRLARGSRQRPTGPIVGQKIHSSFVLLGLFISTLMITPLSQFLWDHLPLLPVVQFPWRFLSVQALFAAAATAALVPARHPTPNTQYPIPNTQYPTRSPLSIFRSSFSILSAAFLIASTLLSLHPERLAVGPADVTVERLQLYELFAGNVGTTIRYEWLPNTANPRPFTSDGLIEPDAALPAIPLDRASLQAVLIERKPTRQVWQVWGAGGEIAFPLLYWPGWKARIGGEPAKVWPVEGSGYLALQVPAGEHTVTLWLGLTPVRTAAEITSLAAFVALSTIIAKSLITNHKSRITNRKSQIRRWALVILASLVICYLSSVILPRVTFDDEPALSDLTMDFVKIPYLHHNPDGVDFDGVVRLAGYTLSAEELTPGATLIVDLNWSQVTGPFTTTLQLVSPAAIRYDVAPLAKTTSNLQPPTSNLQYPISTPITLQLPQDIARGVYLIQLNLFGPGGKLQARTPRGKGQGTLYLQPVRVTQGPSLPRDMAVLAAFGPAIRLYAATVTQLAPDRMAVQLDWSAVYPLAANYSISLRLLDARGQVRAQLDTQPGYGFLPTSSWRPGERITDRYVLTVPDDLPAEAGYHLEIVLYQASTLESVGQMQVGGFALPLKAAFEARRPPRTFFLPSRGSSLVVDFGGEVRLAGFDLAPGQGEEEQEDAIRLTLWWQALQNLQADYTVFVHLFDPAMDSIVTQSDAQPRGGTYPTSWWIAGEVISDTVMLSLEDTPEGTYRLAVGLYDQTFTRLPAVPRAGQEEIIISQDRLILPAVVTVKR